jgi:hypothetical protein
MIVMSVIIMTMRSGAVGCCRGCTHELSPDL